MRWVIPIPLAVLLLACAGAQRPRAQALARELLSCPVDRLGLQDLGTLVVGVDNPHKVDLYEARCADRVMSLYCTSNHGCAADPAAVVGSALVGDLERIMKMRRTVSRARCPSDTVRAVQESYSLFRYEACDGRWSVHCVGDRCERLLPAL